VIDIFGFNNFHRSRDNEREYSEGFHRYFFPRHPHGPRPPDGGRPHPHHFGPPPFMPPPPPGGLMPIGREGFNEMKILFLLTIVAEYKEGITIYQLNSKFNFSRGMLLNTFDSLEKEGYLKTEKDEVKGREQKYYRITDAGRKYLDELRNRWANHFAIMSEMAPPEHFGEKFLHKGFKRLLLGRFEELESKQEMLDYLKRLSAWINSMLHRLDERKNHLEIKHQKLAELTEKLNTIDKWDKQEFKSLIKEYFSK